MAGGETSDAARFLKVGAGTSGVGASLGALGRLRKCKVIVAAAAVLLVVVVVENDLTSCCHTQPMNLAPVYDGGGHTQPHQPLTCVLWWRLRWLGETAHKPCIIELFLYAVAVAAAAGVCCCCNWGQAWPLSWHLWDG